MEFSTYIYENSAYKIVLNKVPNFMDRTKETGRFDAGSILFVSQREADEYYGPEAELEIMWEAMSAMSYRHGRAVRDSIRQHNAIDVTVEKSEQEWLGHHEFTMWWGRRQKYMHRRLYGIGYVHGLYYCEDSKRKFDLQARVHRSVFESYEPYLIEAMKSIECH